VIQSKASDFYSYIQYIHTFSRDTKYKCTYECTAIPDVYICINAIYVELTTGMNMYSIVEKLSRNVNFELRLEKVWVE
jgi:hypothetical protein